MLLNDENSKEFRKKLNLPTTKDVRYFRKENMFWKEYAVNEIEIVNTYMPSESSSLRITLANGERVNILSDYLAEMQKTTFISEEDEPTSNTDRLICPSGTRIDATPKSYVVVDIETTGLNHFKDKIIEIGAIKYEEGVEKSRLSVLINQGVKLSKTITKLTGITDEMLAKEGINEKDAICKLKNFIGDNIIIGHNFCTFDSHFIGDAYKKDLNEDFNSRYVDTLFLARRVCFDLDRHNLECLSKKYGINYFGAHRAVEDCAINHYVYEFMAFGNLLNDDLKSFNDSKSNNLNDDVSIQEEDEDVEDSTVYESLSEAELFGWKSVLHKELERLNLNLSLPENSIRLMANKSKDRKTITSYSICIYEPDIISGTSKNDRPTIVTRITEGKLKTMPDVLTIEPKNINEFDNLVIPDIATVKTPKSSLPYMRIDGTTEECIAYLLESVRFAVKNYKAKASNFACCSRYIQCSAEKKCIHPNQLFSKACAYRKNMENGKIFY